MFNKNRKTCENSSRARFLKKIFIFVLLFNVCLQFEMTEKLLSPSSDAEVSTVAINSKVCGLNSSLHEHKSPCTMLGASFLSGALSVGSLVLDLHSTKSKPNVFLQTNLKALTTLNSDFIVSEIADSPSGLSPPLA